MRRALEGLNYRILVNPSGGWEYPQPPDFYKWLRQINFKKDYARPATNLEAAELANSQADARLLPLANAAAKTPTKQSPAPWVDLTITFSGEMD